MVFDSSYGVKEYCIYLGSIEKAREFEKEHPDDRIIFYFDIDKAIYEEIDIFIENFDDTIIAWGLENEMSIALNIIPEDETLEGLASMIASWIHTCSWFSFSYIFPHRANGKIQYWLRSGREEY